MYYSAGSPFSWLPLGQGDDERCAAANLAPGRDAPVVALYDSAADGKPHSRPFIGAFAVQALKHGEDAVEKLFVKSYAVIFNEETIRLPPTD